MQSIEEWTQNRTLCHTGPRTEPCRIDHVMPFLINKKLSLNHYLYLLSMAISSSSISKSFTTSGMSSGGSTTLVWKIMLIMHSAWEGPIIALDKMFFFFNPKVLIFFLFLHENICCGYSLEASHWGTSNEYPQYMFSWRNNKNIYLIPTLIWSYGRWVVVFSTIKYHYIDPKYLDTLSPIIPVLKLQQDYFTACWCVANSVGLIRWHILQHLIWVYIVCSGISLYLGLLW